MSHELDFLPIGREIKCGDAILFRFWDSDNGESEKEQKICLFDGGYADDGEKIERHLKKHYKSTHINLVVSTHPDTDHVRGLKYVLENLEVDELWMHRPWLHAKEICKHILDKRVNPHSLETRMSRKLWEAYAIEELAIQKNIKIKEPFAGMSKYYGVIKVLSPSKKYYLELLKRFTCIPDVKIDKEHPITTQAKEKLHDFIDSSREIDKLDTSPETGATNDSSTVILLNIDNKKFLLTGDAGVPSLSLAADTLENLGYKANCADFIQIPHHGGISNVTSALLNRLVGNIRINYLKADKIGLISVCKRDNAKHPSKLVLDAFKRRGVEIHKTNGATLVHQSCDLPPRRGYKLSQGY